MIKVKSPITVLLADDHAIMRRGLRLVLEAAGIQVVGEASSGWEAVDLALERRPAVTLLNVRIPNGNSLNVIPEVRAACPQTAVLILTNYQNPAYLTRALAAGAAGYLPFQRVTPEQLVDAVKAIVNGESRVDSAWLCQAARLWESAARPVPVN